MKLPARVAAEVEAALAEEPGKAVRLVSARGVGGGCISETARVEIEGGSSAFLKWLEESAPAGLLSAEARSLEALRASGAVRVPEVQAAGERWLLLEWLEPGRMTPEGWTRLGAELAKLHRTTAESFGWPEDNFIGSLPQPNGWCEQWPTFWRERRLAPQVALASRSGLLRGRDPTALGRLLQLLDRALAAAAEEGPSLLHGDLWNGNVHALRDGTAAVVDPASYFGHREVDLAMAELFGGFDARFFDAYRAAWPVQEGYEVRRPIYQLYYLLVHVNLFGGSYLGGMRAAADAALAAFD